MDLATDDKSLRLQVFLSRAGAASSRRKAEELINAGQVRLNGQIATLGAIWHPGDQVELNGKRLELPLASRVLVLHKPAGYTTTRSDRHAEHTVFELVPVWPGLHPVGRLDRESEGVLLFATDGRLTARLTHPRYQVPKVYRVDCGRDLTPAELTSLRHGVVLNEGPARPDLVRPVKAGVELTLHEGKKREVRRIFTQLHLPLLRLVRSEFAQVKLEGLAPGTYRELTAREIQKLWSLGQGKTSGPSNRNDLVVNRSRWRK